MPEKEGGSFSGHPEDSKFLKRLGERFTFSQEIDRLDRESLGRSIFLVYPPAATRDEALVLVGSILPLRRDGTQHLIIFKNGDGFLTEPLFSKDPNADNSEAIEAYQEYCSPDELPLERSFRRSTGDTNKDIARIVSWLSYDLNMTKANKSQEGVKLLNIVYGKALRLAKEQKEEREGLRDNSITIFNEMMKRNFKKEDEPSEPKKEPPYDVPPTSELPPFV